MTIGIFPASHVHVRDELPDAEGRLAQIIARARTSHPHPAPTMLAPSNTFHMATLREDDEMSLSDLRSNPHGNSLEKQEAPRPTLKSGDETASGLVEPLVDEIASALREWHARLFTYLSRRDYRTFTAVREHIDALHLGRRQLLARTGESAGVGLISADEAVALRRECVMRLVRGNVAQGLDVLVRHPAGGALVGVEADFTPSPVTANASAATKRSDTSNWVSSIRMYAMQSALAYIDAQGNGTGGYKPSALGPVQDLFAPPAPIPTPAKGVPAIQPPSPYTSQTRSRSHSASQSPTSPSRLNNRQQYTTNASPTPTQRPKFFHIYLDLRAFVAAPCAPGELTELFFSIYSRASAAFVTEDFCVVLNRSGVRAGNAETDDIPHSPDGGVRDISEFGLVDASESGLGLSSGSGGRNGSSLALNLSPLSPLSPSSSSLSIRTLFTDLGAHDLAEGLVLVCRIVRRGGMKMAPDGDGSSKNDNGVSYGGMGTISESYNGTMSDMGHTSGGMGNGSMGGVGGSVGASARRGSEPMYRSVWEDSVSQLGDKAKSPSGKKSTGLGKNGTVGSGGRNGSAGRNGMGSLAEEDEPLRRPFGCAVLELDALVAPMLSEHGAGVGAPGSTVGSGAATGIGAGSGVGAGAGGTGFGPAREYTMPIFVPVDEARFSTLHQDILQGHGHAVEKSPRWAYIS